METRRNRFDEIAAAIGEDGALKLCREFGGMSLYIPSIRSAVLKKRNQVIYTRFQSGTKVGQLALEYGITERAVFFVLREERDKRR